MKQGGVRDLFGLQSGMDWALPHQFTLKWTKKNVIDPQSFHHSSRFYVVVKLYNNPTVTISKGSVYRSIFPPRRHYGFS